LTEVAIKSKELLNLLLGKGVNFFHHANTVKTSLTFIDQGAMMSRAYVEANGLTQTSQSSDAVDKEFDIWDVVFLDGTDLHKKFGRRNEYGPILFLLDLNILENFESVRVTKTNPSYWRTAKTKFFSSSDEINKNYLTGDSFQDGQTMFLFDKPEKTISLEKYCRKIIVDDPKLILVSQKDNSEKAIADMVLNTISSALTNSKLSNIEVLLRHKEERTPCSCSRFYQAMYKSNKEKFDKLFKK